MAGEFDKKLGEEIEAISIKARSRGFGVSQKVIYKTKFTTIIAHAFHIPRPDGTIHHFDLKINKYKRKKTTEPWVSALDDVEQDDDGDFQSLKIDYGNGSAVKKLTEFLEAQFEALGQKLEKTKFVIDNPKDIDLTFLKYLDREKLKDASSLVSVAHLEGILKDWQSNSANDNEEFWIKLFQEKNWILSQIFSCPFILIGKKFYCGGKEDDDKGGVKGDLLYKNHLTGNLALIEIKTPETDLIGPKYRGEEDGKENIIFSMSNDVTGGVTQVLNQRKLYLKTHGDHDGKFLNNARCVLLIGKVNKLSPDERKSFELYRSSSKEVEIVTYDELFGRIDSLLNILKN
jgi:hypothetical protein